MNITTTNNHFAIDILNSENIINYKCNEKVLDTSICTNNIYNYTIKSFLNKLSEECDFYERNVVDEEIEEPILSDNCFKYQDSSVSGIFHLKEVMIGSMGLIAGVSIGILGSMKYHFDTHYSLI